MNLNVFKRIADAEQKIADLVESQEQTSYNLSILVGLIEKSQVAKDIKKQFRDFSILKTYDSNVSVPSNKELVNKIWKAHKKGERSKVYQHSIRIQKINEVEIQ